MQIGSVEGSSLEYSFGFVTDAVRLSDGRLVVLDQMAGDLRVFDEAGSYLGTWARKGEGPGELRRPRDIVRLPSDSLLITEFGGTSTVFDSTGTFVRRFRVPVEEWSMGDIATQAFSFSRYGLVDWIAADSYLVQLRGWIARGPGRQPERVALARFSEDGSGDTIALLATGEYETAPKGSGLNATGTHFNPQVTTAAFDGQVYASNALAYAYGVYSPSGELVRVARLLRRREPVDQYVKDDFREFSSRGWAQAGEPGMSQSRLRAVFDRTPYPDSLPALWALRIDPTGSVWCEAMPAGDWAVPSSSHYVFDPTDVFLGVVAAPRGLRITDIGSDYVLGVWRDENEVSFVRLHDLSRKR